MFVTIKNFRCHQLLELQINSNIVHISGDSGAGKTTIYEAIKWCVHGPKITVVPTGQKSTTVKTEVSIAHNRFSITRSNNPRKITYQDVEGILTGEEAQSKINHLFGTHPLWMVEQRKDHLLMNAKDDEKREAIMDLLFPDNNHKLCIANIKTNYKHTLGELENSKIRCSELGVFIREEVRIHGLTQQHFDAVPRLQDLEDKITLKNGEIEAGIANNAALNQFLNRKSSLESRLLGYTSIEEYKHQLMDVNVMLDNTQLLKLLQEKIELEKSIQSHSKMVIQLSKVNEVSTKLNELNTQIANLQTQIEKCTNLQKTINCRYTELNAKEFQELVGRMQSQLNMRTLHLSRAARLGLTYTEEARQTELEKLTGMIVTESRSAEGVVENIASVRIQHQQLVQLLEAKVRVAQELPVREKSLKESIELVTNIEKENINITASIARLEADLYTVVEQKEKLLSQYQLALLTESCRRLTCPHCNNECGLINSKLVKMEEVPEINTSSVSIMNSINLLSNRSSTIQRDVSQFRSLINTNNLRLGNTKSTIITLQTHIESLKKTMEVSVDSSTITTMTHKIKNHDSAIGRIHEVRMIDVIEVEDLTNDKEWWRLQDLIIREREVYNHKLVMQSELQSQLESHNLELSSCGSAMDVNQLRRELARIITSITETTKNIAVWTQTAETLRSTITTLEMLESEKLEVQSSPLNGGKLIEVSALQEYVAKLSRDVNGVRRARDLQSRRNDYQSLSGRISELATIIETGGKVLTAINSFKYIAIENAMTQLSQFCNQVLEHIFDESILMKITTIKVMKSGVKKNRIHIDMLRNGLPVDYTSLSGGQKERVSLAITLAISMSHPSTVQMILLDEVLSCLNEDNRERCLKLFNRSPDHNPLFKMMEPLLNSKIFLFTDHIVNEHYFDQVITIRGLA